MTFREALTLHHPKSLVNVAAVMQELPVERGLVHVCHQFVDTALHVVVLRAQLMYIS